MTVSKLIESVNHSDTGCPDGMYPSCLSCPLPRCRWEEPRTSTKRRNEMAEQRREAKRLFSEGLTYTEIASRLGVSRTTAKARVQG